MKDYSKKEVAGFVDRFDETDIDHSELIKSVLADLYKDRKHSALDFIAPGLKYSDLAHVLAIVWRKMKRNPSIRVDIELVPHGYQVDIYKNGKHLGFECRDFGGDRPVYRHTNSLIAKLMEAIDDYRKAH